MLEILNLQNKNDIDKYNNIYKIINISDPYLLYDYIRFFSKGINDLVSFYYHCETSNVHILLPGYLTNIKLYNASTPYYHFTTPYGYTGPLFQQNIVDNEIINFWKEINYWYNNNNVISEFVRFNLFENSKNYDSIIHNTMLNVKGRIIDEETQWKSFDSKVRKNVNRAKREGLEFQIFYLNIPEIEIEKFYNIYIQTMVRTKASKSFFYQLIDFISFIKSNPTNTALCNVYFNNEVISSEMILISDNTIFSFLGGTNEQYFHKRPNDLLKYELINWARIHRKEFYVLGGGYGYEDGIFNYKKSFFPNDIVEYKTGRKIVNSKKYYELIEINNKLRIDRGLKPLLLNDNTFFPLYNKTD